MKKYYYSSHTYASYLEKNCGLSQLRNEAIVLEFEFEWNWENSAEILAEDYYYNHDGWEDDWPVLFRIWDEEGGW